MSNEEVEKVEKTQEEVEEVSKKEVEKVQKLTEEVPEEVQVVAEEVEQKNEPKFTDIKKLKCDYTIYKREREKLKMKVIEKCSKCGKKFKDGDELYIGHTKKGDIEQNLIICKKCAK